jgi:HPt (histidine-containing phosphotransfer) domain-containing protein
MLDKREDAAERPRRVPLAEDDDANRELERETPPSTGVLDPAIVEQLRMLARAGNSELLARLEVAFARDTPTRLAALRSAIANGDHDAVAFNAHTLKGSAANLGAIHVVAACKAIEGAAESAGAEDIEPLAEALDEAAATAQSALARLARSG